MAATPIITRQYGPDPKGSPLTFSELDTNNLYFQNMPAITAGYLPISNPTQKDVNAGGGIVITYPVGYTVTESILRQVGGFGTGSVTFIGLSGSLAVTGGLDATSISSSFFTGSMVGSLTGSFTGSASGSFSGSFSGSATGIFSGSHSGSFDGTGSGKFLGLFTGSLAGTSSGLLFYENGVNGGITLRNGAGIQASESFFALVGGSKFQIDGTSSLNGYAITENTQIGNTILDKHIVSGSLIEFDVAKTSFKSPVAFSSSISTTATGPVALGSTLTVQGNSTISGSLAVKGNLSFSGSLVVSGGAANFENPVATGDTLSVSGNTSLSSSLLVAGAITSSNTTDSTSTLNGAIVTAGGLGVAKNLNIGQTLAVNGATSLSSSLQVSGASVLNSTLAVSGLSTLRASAQVTGTLGVSSDAAVGGNFSVSGNSKFVGTAEVTGTLNVISNTQIGGTLSVLGITTLGGATQINNTLGTTGVLTSTNTTDATSTSTGAIKTSGGVGIAKALWVGGLSNIAGALTVGGATQLNSTLGATGVVTLTDTTEATSTTTGAIKSSGGMGLAKNLWVGGTLNVAGAVSLGTITGNLVNSLTVDNSSLQLDSGTTYNNSAARTISVKALGITNAMIANTTIANAKLVNTTVTIGTTAIALGASSTTLAGLTSVTSTGFTGALTGNADTATKLATARTIGMTGNVVWTSPSFDGSGNVTAAATIQAGVVTDSMLAGSISNGKLSNSSLTVTAGTGMSGGGSVSLGGTVTLTNAGVTSNVAGTNITVSAATGAVTIGVSNSPTFSGNATAAGFFQSSKRELKTDIIKFEKNALDIINNTEVVEFKYKNDLDTVHIGIIADDSPEEIATKNHDKFDTNSTVAILLKAVQEMSAEIKELKEQLANK